MEFRFFLKLTLVYITLNLFEYISDVEYNSKQWSTCFKNDQTNGLSYIFILK